MIRFDYHVFLFSFFFLFQGGSHKDIREVRQFHFTSWPDHGVPDFPTAMLTMIRTVRVYHYTQSNTGPMVVHCSAGVGRTGTFIVIDSMLSRVLNGDEYLDIYGFVTLLRHQRNFMIQTDVRKADRDLVEGFINGEDMHATPTKPNFVTINRISCLGCH